jgi:hypothetical protein
LALEYAVPAGSAAKFIPGAFIALAKARAAFAAEAGFAGEAVLSGTTVAVSWNAGWICTYVLRRADVPFLAALPVTAGLLRTALPTAFDRSFTAIAAALALDAELIIVAAAIVRRPRLVMLADRPTARCAADRMVLIRIPVEQNLDKAVRTAAGIA